MPLELGRLVEFTGFASDHPSEEIIVTWPQVGMIGEVVDARFDHQGYIMYSVVFPSRTGGTHELLLWDDEFHELGYEQEL